MKILILGSKPRKLSVNQKRDFESACRDLGSALAKAGHTIVVGSDGSNIADRFIVEGANTVEGLNKVTVVYSSGSAIPFASDYSKFTRINFAHVEIKDTWVATRPHQIDAADGVILIGGGQGTLAVGYQAPKRKRPVLPIPSFGGAAADLWTEFERDYDRHWLSAGDISLLKGDWKPSSAETAVRLIEQLIEYSSQLEDRDPLSQEGSSSRPKEAGLVNSTLNGVIPGAINRQEEITKIRAQIGANLWLIAEGQDKGTSIKQENKELIERLIKLDESGIAAVRQLVTSALDDNDLNILSFDYFRDVYDKISSTQGKAAKIQALIEYCYRQEKVSSLLEQIERLNAAKYAQFLRRWVVKGEPLE